MLNKYCVVALQFSMFTHFNDSFIFVWYRAFLLYSISTLGIWHLMAYGFYAYQLNSNHFYCRCRCHSHSLYVVCEMPIGAKRLHCFRSILKIQQVTKWPNEIHQTMKTKFRHINKKIRSFSCKSKKQEHDEKY